MVVGTLYQSAIILNHFEGLNLSLSALKISDLEQLNRAVFIPVSADKSFKIVSVKSDKRISLFNKSKLTEQLKCYERYFSHNYVYALFLSPYFNTISFKAS